MRKFVPEALKIFATMSEDNEGSVEIDMEGNEDDAESNGSSGVDEEHQADNESVGGGSTVVPPSANSGKSGFSCLGQRFKEPLNPAIELTSRVNIALSFCESCNDFHMAMMLIFFTARKLKKF